MAGEGKGRGRQRGRFLVFHFLSSYITLCSTRHQINNGPTYPILSQPEQVRAVCTLRVLCARSLLVSLLYSPSISLSLVLFLPFSLHLAPFHVYPLSPFLSLFFPLSLSLPLYLFLSPFLSLVGCATRLKILNVLPIHPWTLARPDKPTC